MIEVLLFSGGRTSGYMLYRKLQAGWRGMIIFCNTGKEMPQTLEFVRRCGVEFGVEIIWLEPPKSLFGGLKKNMK